MIALHAEIDFRKSGSGGVSRGLGYTRVCSSRVVPITLVSLMHDEVTVPERRNRLPEERFTSTQRDARARVSSIRKNREIPALKAIEELTSCIRALKDDRSRYALAEAYAVRGTAFARGMEDHKSSFRDWRRSLGIIAGENEPSTRFFNLAGYVRVQMAFHSEGSSRMRFFNLAMNEYRAADNPRAFASVLVHRGLEWKERGEYRRALKDLEEGLAIARWKRMEGRRQLLGFIDDVRTSAGNRGHRS